MHAEDAPHWKEKVRVEGLEPPCLAAPDPKSGTSTNFATPASLKRGLSKKERKITTFWGNINV